MPESPMPQTAGVQNQILLGLDYGTVKLGVAVGQTLTGCARPLEILPVGAGGLPWARLDYLVQTWRPHALVLGMPYHMDGSDTALVAPVQRFAAQLRTRYALPVHLADERLTTHAARALLSAQPERKRKQRLGPADAVAAKLILETWLADTHAAT